MSEVGPDNQKKRSNKYFYCWMPLILTDLQSFFFVLFLSEPRTRGGLTRKKSSEKDQTLKGLHHHITDYYECGFHWFFSLPPEHQDFDHQYVWKRRKSCPPYYLP